MATASPEQLAAERFAIVHAIGECLMAWANAEERVHELFVQQLTALSENPNRYAVARFVWFSIIGFDNRLRMTDAAVKGNARNTDVQHDWKVLHNHIAKLSVLRNEAAHGLIVNVDNREMQVMPYGSDVLKRRPRLSLKDIHGRTKLFIELVELVSWFYTRISTQIKPNPVLEALPIPRAMQTLRSQASKTTKAQASAERKRGR